RVLRHRAVRRGLPALHGRGPVDSRGRELAHWHAGDRAGAALGLARAERAARGGVARGRGHHLRGGPGAVRRAPRRAAPEGLRVNDPAAYLADLVLKIPALLIAVTIHEVAHALVADRLGDPTPRALGRITLNPFPHIDLFGALAFVVAGFGWAKPVPVNAANLRHPRRDMALVAAAGPVSNFLMAFVGLVLFVLARQSGLVGAPVAQVLLWIFQFNLALGIFNLIPLPPLDGRHFLPS